jgi:hypothetical protein
MNQQTYTPPQIDLSSFYTPHQGTEWNKGQAYLHFDVDAKVKVLKVGRRWGKSRFAFWEMMRRYVEALNIPVPNSLVPPFHAWIVVPSFPQARQTWNELLSFIPKEVRAVRGVHMEEMYIELKGSEYRPWGLIEVKSAANVEGLQTAGLDFLWVQEAQDIPDKAFEKVLPTLRSPNRMGYAVFEGIPALWSDHWFQKAFSAAERGRRGYHAFHATAFDNPMLTEGQIEEIESDKEILPDRAWRRMYLAEFSDEAGYFKNVENCISGDLLTGTVPGARYVGGLDLGRKRDASVLHILDASERKVVFHYTWDEGESWPLQRESVTRMVNDWGLERIVVDASSFGGDIFTQELIEAGIPVEPFQITWTSRTPLLETLAVALERESIHFPPIPPLLRQLRAFQHRKMSSGNVKLEAPPGEHDDEVFALALGLTACDPAQEVAAAMRRYGRRGSYVPTQSEAHNGAPEGRGAMFMRERISEKVRQRAEAVGVE